jgi:phage protein D
MPEATLSSMSVYSARPTIRVADQAYAKLNELLLAMEMTEQEGGMSALELRFSNVASDPEGGADLAFEDNQILKLGQAIALYAGDENSPREIFRGNITALEAVFPFSEEGARPELLVLAEDMLQQARMERHTAVHNAATISDLATQLAQRLSLTPVITGFSQQIGPQVQLNESDLAFLRRLLARYDGDIQVVGRELHVSPRSEVQREALELKMYSQLRKVRVLADLAHQVTEVQVTGWDVSQGRKVTGNSRGSQLGAGRGTPGARILSQTLGNRPHVISHLAVTTEAEAQALADTAFDQRARRFVCVEGSAEGNPMLRVGTQIQLIDLGRRFDNTYYVTRTCHHFDREQGYQTNFEAECAFFGGAS